VGIKMEQYWMPKKLDWKNLRICLDNYEARGLYIRDCGGVNPDGSFRAYGKAKASLDLGGRKLDFRKSKKGLYILVNDKEVFHFSLEDVDKGFSLAYERIKKLSDGSERKIILRTGMDPYDPALPEPHSSVLRTVLDDHLMEISFEGRIDLKFHSWWQKPYLKYRTVVKPRKNKRTTS